jgi:hypothetical protein
MREHERRQGRRQVDRLGRTVTLINFEKDGNDSRGSRWVKTADSPEDINAIIQPGGGSPYSDVFGADVSYSMVFVIRDEHRDDVTDSGSPERASIVQYLGDDWEVDTANPYHDMGVLVLGCNAGEL